MKHLTRVERAATEGHLWLCATLEDLPGLVQKGSRFKWLWQQQKRSWEEKHFSVLLAFVQDILLSR